MNDIPQDIINERVINLKLYERFIDIIVEKFESLNKRFVAIDIIDLRLIGVIIIIVGIVGKFKNAFSDSPQQIFTPMEFVTIISIGSILLVLGSYFGVRKVMENRKVVEEASKLFHGRLQEGEWSTPNNSSKQYEFSK